MVNSLFMLLRGLFHRHGRRIKIMKADGTVMKLRSPLSVKEILIDYPNHGIFETAAFGFPLPERAGLIAGQLYYLIPFPFPQNELINYNNNRGHFARSSSCRLQTPSSAGRATATATATDSVKQEGADEISIRGGVRIVSSSYAAHRSTVRVKLRIRKEELASFLSAKNVSIVEKNVVLAPPFQGATRQSRPWKPRLDTIAESQSPLRDL